MQLLLHFKRNSLCLLASCKCQPTKCCSFVTKNSVVFLSRWGYFNDLTRHVRFLVIYQTCNLLTEMNEAFNKRPIYLLHIQVSTLCFFIGVVGFCLSSQSGIMSQWNAFNPVLYSNPLRIYVLSQFSLNVLKPVCSCLEEFLLSEFQHQQTWRKN